MDEKKLVIIIAALTQLTTQLIANMVILAMPEIAVDMNLGVSFETQIYLIYLVAVVAFTIPLSKIVAQYGVKRCMIICYVALIVSLLISIFAVDVNFIFVSRIIQGICVAILLVTIYILVVTELPENEVGSALGIVGSCGYIGLMSAPTLMGVLLHFINWRLAFAFFIPLMAVQIILLLKVKKEYRADKKPIDKSGIILFVLAMLVFVAGLTTLHSNGIVLILFSILIFILFIWVEKGKENPMYNVKLLNDFNFIVQEFSGFFKPGMNCTFSGLVSIFFLCGWGDAITFQMLSDKCHIICRFIICNIERWGKNFNKLIFFPFFFKHGFIIIF